MKHIEFTKKTNDRRPNKSRVFNKGERVEVLDPLADEYIQAKEAKLVESGVKTLEQVAEEDINEE